MTVPKQFVDALRLSREEVERILSEMERTASTYRGDERRSEPRYAFLGHHVVLVEIHYPNKHVGTYRAVTQNISTRGIGFLHGAFVYPGSACRVILRDTRGGLFIVQGTVARCKLVEGRVHEVGMQFDEAIDLAEVVPREELERGPLGSPARQETQRTEAA